MESLHSRITSGRHSARLLAAALVILAPTTLSIDAQAQSVGSIAGIVRDSGGRPVTGVEVRVASTGIVSRTDTTGAFRFADVPTGKRELNLRRLGFEPASVNADVTKDRTIAVTIVLEVMAVELPGVVVAEMVRQRNFLRDFYDRSEKGFGHFITREQIEKRNPANLSDMMRQIPGARLIPNRNGGTATLRFSRAIMAPGRDCPPQYWVDGVKTWALNIDDIIPQDVEGIEVYSGPSALPAQFNTRDGTTICGVVLIWTRIPGKS
jgi:hypothetical protein